MWQTKELSVEIRNCATIRKWETKGQMQFVQPCDVEADQIASKPFIKPQILPPLLHMMRSLKHSQKLKGSLISPSHFYISHLKMSQRKWKTKTMNYHDNELGFDWTTEIEPCYESYALSEGPFQHKSFTIKLEDDPLLCFKRLKRAKEYQKYCLFAQELIQIAGNAVKLETSFKTVRIVHNQWRRSLRKDRLAKLVKCHYNIPNIEKVKGMPIV
eukprot:753642_1